MASLGCFQKLFIGLPCCILISTSAWGYQPPQPHVARCIQNLIDLGRTGVFVDEMLLEGAIGLLGEERLSDLHAEARRHVLDGGIFVEAVIFGRNLQSLSQEEYWQFLDSTIDLWRDAEQKSDEALLWVAAAIEHLFRLPKDQNPGLLEVDATMALPVVDLIHPEAGEEISWRLMEGLAKLVSQILQAEATGEDLDADEMLGTFQDLLIKLLQDPNEPLERSRVLRLLSVYDSEALALEGQRLILAFLDGSRKDRQAGIALERALIEMGEKDELSATDLARLGSDFRAHLQELKKGWKQVKATMKTDRENLYLEFFGRWAMSQSIRSLEQIHRVFMDVAPAGSLLRRQLRDLHELLDEALVERDVLTAAFRANRDWDFGTFSALQFTLHEHADLVDLELLQEEELQRLVHLLDEQWGGAPEHEVSESAVQARWIPESLHTVDEEFDVWIRGSTTLMLELKESVDGSQDFDVSRLYSMIHEADQWLAQQDFHIVESPGSEGYRLIRRLLILDAIFDSYQALLRAEGLMPNASPEGRQSSIVYLTKLRSKIAFAHFFKTTTDSDSFEERAVTLASVGLIGQEFPLDQLRKIQRAGWIRDPDYFSSYIEEEFLP